MSSLVLVPRTPGAFTSTDYLSLETSGHILLEDGTGVLLAETISSGLVPRVPGTFGRVVLCSEGLRCSDGLPCGGESGLGVRSPGSLTITPRS